MSTTDQIETTSSRASSVHKSDTEKVSAIHNTKEHAGFKISNSRDADATLKFQEEHDSQVPEITPEQERRLSRKVSWFIVGLTAFINLVLYMDKATLSYGTLLGLMEDTKLSSQDYNNANTLFYVGYAVGQIPGIYLMQKMPLGKFLFILVALWAVITFLSCTMFNPAGVIALRFFLGFVESVVVPILNTTMGQFLTADEKAASAPIFYSTCLGVTIPAGFIAYGVLYIDSSVALWKIFMLIIGALALVSAVLIWFFYPDNPTNVKFFTIEEKVWIIRRVQRTTNSSIEQKTFKKYQFIEALKDPVSWLFAAFNFLLMLANNLPYQQNLLFTEMGGISDLDSTLVSVASGGFAALCAIIATLVLQRYPNTSAISTVVWMLPSLVGAILAVALPWDNKTGLLAALCLACPSFGVPYIIMFSWTTTSCSGYTKKLTRNGLLMFAYSVANIISPQLWQERDGPRYVPAWVVQIVLSFGIAPFIAVVIHVIFKRRNTERLANIDKFEKVGVILEGDKEVVVNVAALDLTDLENKTFLYPL